MTDEIEMLRARLRDVERERDAALEGERQAEAQSDLHHRLLMEACDERDAARAEVARLTARLAEVEAELDRQGAPREWGSSCPQNRTPAERLREMMREWREATMLDDQDHAIPAHLRQWLQDFGEDLDRLRARLAEVETVSDELHAALAGLEWAGGRESCPQCGWTVKHMPKCELRRALDVATLLHGGGA